ncbi:MAG TPA: LysR family transcriptional regulator [Telluria sp.]|jgi:DNA-binding transcriptional LysR family regulator
MIDAMKVFLAAVEAGSLSQVARERSVAVSSVARKIDALEEELGVKLLSRSSRQLLLTDAGEAFVPRARAIVSELNDARHAIAEMSADPRGQLTVTAPASFGRRHVVRAVASFLAQYPAIEIVLHLSDQLLDLSAQRVDVAVRMGVLPDSDLVATVLAPVQRFVCASPAYLERHGRPAALADLLKHNCLTLATMPWPLGWWTFAGINGEQPLPVKGNLRTDDTEAMLRAGLEGVGIVHLASWLVSDDIVAGRLVPLFEPALAAKGPRLPAIHAVRLPGRSHAAKAQLFIAHLRREFGEPAYWDVALDALTA